MCYSRRIYLQTYLSGLLLLGRTHYLNNPCYSCVSIGHLHRNWIHVDIGKTHVISYLVCSWIESKNIVIREYLRQLNVKTLMSVKRIINQIWNLSIIDFFLILYSKLHPGYYHINNSHDEVGTFDQLQFYFDGTRDWKCFLPETTVLSFSRIHHKI